MKKIIAKEFLILLSVIAIALISFPITYGYNVILSNQKQTLEDSLNNTPSLSYENINKLKLAYNNKIEVQIGVFELATDIFSNVGVGRDIETRYKYWKVLLNDSYNNFINEYNSKRSYWKYYSNYHSDTIDSFESFKAFLVKYTVNEKEQSDYDLAISNENYRNNIENRIKIIPFKILNDKKQIKVALNTFYILFTIAFILRFLMISIKWSIKELKS